MNECRVCESTFKKKSYQQIYCSIDCRDNFHKQQQIEKVLINGPLTNERYFCKQCDRGFIRNNGRQQYCQSPCMRPSLRPRKQKRIKKVYTPKDYKNTCIICNIGFKARIKSQKTCSKQCRKVYGLKQAIKYNNDKRKTYYTQKSTKCITNRLKANLRSRIYRASKDQYSGIKLGCSQYKLKIYLQLLWTRRGEDGELMTWDNYGYNGWHIDHIKPLSKVDFSNKEEAEAASHYTNLQPMWAKDNMKKGNKYE